MTATETVTEDPYVVGAALLELLHLGYGNTTVYEWASLDTPCPPDGFTVSGFRQAGEAEIGFHVTTLPGSGGRIVSVNGRGDSAAAALADALRQAREQA